MNDFESTSRKALEEMKNDLGKMQISINDATADLRAKYERWERNSRAAAYLADNRQNGRFSAGALETPALFVGSSALVFFTVAFAVLKLM